jgi:hypothetical protein
MALQIHPIEALLKGINMYGQAVTKLVALLPEAGALVATRASAIAARLGIAQSKVNPKTLIQMVRKNKVAAAFVAYELYGAGSEIVSEMAASDAELGRIIETLGYQPDVVKDTTNVNNISQFVEEFETITHASDAVGGLDRLIAIRKALTFDNDMFELYMNVREMRNIF